MRAVKGKNKILSLINNPESDTFSDAAKAIMTTDTYPKGVHTKLNIENTIDRLFLLI